MYSSENAIDIISRCGGYYKSSILEGLISPRALFDYLKRRNELLPLFKRARCQGELIYYLPPKYVVPWWNYRPHEVNEYGLFRSFALLLYFKDTLNLPFTGQLLKSQYPDHPKRTYNGVYRSFDEETNSNYLLIVDYFKSNKKLLSIIDSFRAYFKPRVSPEYHIITPRNKRELLSVLSFKRPSEIIQVYSYQQLHKIV